MLRDKIDFLNVERLVQKERQRRQALWEEKSDKLFWRLIIVLAFFFFWCFL